MSLLPVIDNAVALSSDASSADDVFNAGIRFTQAGLVRCTTDNATFFNQGIPMTSEGVVSVVDATAGLPADTVFLNGLPMSNNKLCVSTNSVAVVVNGITFDAAGAVVATGFSGAWTPAQLPSLALWLDADDASTITLNGSNVSQWDDKSGNGRNASQATASFQPTYLATGFNGKPTLQTDGSDALELGVTSLGRNVSGLTCALVGLHPAGLTFISNANELFISSGVNSASTRFAVTPNPSTSTINRYGIAGRRLDADGYSTVSSSTDSLANRGNPWIRFAQRAYSAGVANHWTDGTQDMTNEVVTGQTAGNTSDTDPLRTVLFNGVSALPNGSQLSEIVLTHSTMTNDDRQKLEGYLAWKWGGI